MTKTQDRPKSFRGRAVIALAEPERVLGELLDHMAEHAAVTLTESGALLESPFGVVEVSRFAQSVFVEVLADSPEILALIQAFIVEHVHEYAGEAVPVLWSGEAAAEAAPPRFRKASLLRAFDVTPRMRRLVFACADPALYAADAGYHIRLLFPPEGRAPLWPTARPEGGLDWPAGEDALIGRVYTIREADRAAGTFSVDFALHEGGASPGADFARRARPGDPVGLTGPGGDGLPQADRLLLMGDEAALPAVARMLAEAPPEVEAEVYLEVADAREEQPLPSAARVRAVWLHRGDAPAGRSGLLEAALDERLRAGGLEGRFLWAGCEKAAATRMRKRLAAETPEAGRIRPRVYAYWALEA